jgi:hypothetical protein
LQDDASRLRNPHFQVFLNDAIDPLLKALLVRLGAKILQIGNDSVEPGDLLVELLAFYQVMGQVLLGLV